MNKNINRIKFSSAFLGLLVVFFGLVLLFNSFKIVNLDLNFWQLWPAIIVFIGLSVLSKDNTVSDIISFFSVLIAFALILTIVFCPTKSVNQFDSLNVIRAENVNSVVIELDAGMGKINVSDGAGQQYVVQGETSGNFLSFSSSSSVSNNIQNVIIKAKKTNKSFKGELNNVLNLRITENLPVVLRINGGASVINLDLKQIQLKELEINAAASTIDLVLGENSSQVKINSGFSTVNIKVLEGVGVKLITEQGFSSLNISGLIETEKNTYLSSNYSLAGKKVDINSAIGFANLNFDFYTEEKTKINLYYYNENKDENISCEGEFVLPVEREIVLGENKYETAINLLLQGKITQGEQEQGFVTEFPNPDFKLLNANINDQGVLTLEFTEVPGFTSGGSCRISILANEVIKTVEQFNEVKEVIILPETIFQP